jgi:uncharacterized protein with ATP-grasp and redox domains
MKPTFRCTLCLLRQLQESCEYATENNELRYLAMREAIRYLGGLKSDQIDLKIGRNMGAIVKKFTGNPDPYMKLKTASNQMALRWLLRLRRKHFPFESALRMAAAANSIDYGAFRTTQEPEALFMNGLKSHISKKEVTELRRYVERSKNVLYICDNAGEIAFDKLFVEATQASGPDVTVAVRGGPVLNDATLEDAHQVGIDKLATTISTGSDICGIIPSECSEEFVNVFRRSDLIISKGQANLESLLRIRDKPATAYILRVKCWLIANHLDSQIGSTRIIFDSPW